MIERVTVLLPFKKEIFHAKLLYSTHFNALTWPKRNQQKYK